ncbi:MAG: peptide MFS transporter [Chitinophagaceae bacterium]|nr:peptide MFS transporter [Chitinophagaceae bacterium]
MSQESTVKARHPRGLAVLFFTEMWERFGYYLMVGILFLYLTDSATGGKGFNNRMGADVVGSFIALVYLTPFIGGLIADRYLGYIKSVFLGGSLMAAGYLGLAIPGDTAMYVSLGLIIIGNGFFKPNISTLLGNIYNKEELRPLKDSAYNIFYMGINIGALVCNFVAAYLRNNYGWGYAFSAAGVGLIIGLIWLSTGLKHIRHADEKKPVQAGDMPMSKIFLSVFFPMIVFAIIGWVLPGNLFGSDSNDAFIFACLPVIFFYVQLWRKGNHNDKKSIGSLLFIFTISIIFWTIYNQNSTGLTIWAETYTDRQVSPAIEERVSGLDMLQKATTTPREVNKVDAFLRTGYDAEGNAIKVQGPDPYFNNLPKENWPPEGKELKLMNAELFQSINPFFIVVLTPLLVMLFSYLRRRGKEPSTAGKFGYALIISGLSALVMVFAIMSVSSVYTHKTSPGWLVLTYGVFTVSEICLSPIGLSLVSKLAPQRLTALMMGGWFLSTSLGGKVAGVMASFWDSFPDKKVFFGIIALAAVLGGLLIFSRLKSLNQVVKEKTGSA